MQQPRDQKANAPGAADDDARRRRRFPKYVSPMSAEFSGIPPADLQRSIFLLQNVNNFRLPAIARPTECLRMMEAHMTTLVSRHTEYDSFLYAIVVE